MMIFNAPVLFLLHASKRTTPVNVGRIGAWIQPNSTGNVAALQSCDWFIVDFRVIDKVLPKIGNASVFAAFGAKFIDQVDAIVPKYQGVIKGIILDYETKQSQARAEVELGSIYRQVKSQGLMVGITTLASPASSLKVNGVDFSRAKMYCDFLLPQLYCQLWGNDQEKTLTHYLNQIVKASVPVVPLLAHLTTSKPIRLLPSDLSLNYEQLKLPSFAVWSVKESDAAFWERAKTICT